MSFPRRRESIKYQDFLVLFYVPAYAGMTSYNEAILFCVIPQGLTCHTCVSRGI
ncbi:hypothetical protein [Candidatus Tisiphia endosymbiont of Hybos culiciformis]|uniref:hypothetical protein n=1 Tax=Candidatus Tisiphia endosymbiont of Hybos culiciformis TaxID=3139331 RepID=UPI003CCAC284